MTGTKLLHEAPWYRSKEVAGRVCQELTYEFDIGMWTARNDHKKSTSEQFPDVVQIKMHGCRVIADAGARRQRVLAEEQAVHWIQTGLRHAVEKHIDDEVRRVILGKSKSDEPQAMSHTTLTSYELTMLNRRAGVRDKIQWKPESCAWSLKFNGEKVTETEYCNKMGINLAVPSYLAPGEFEVARDKAFRDACSVWNAIDKSGRRRIAFPNLSEAALGKPGGYRDH